LASISFLINIITQNNGDAAYAFFSPQTCFWELLLGSLMAYASLHQQDRRGDKHRLDVWFSNIIYMIVLKEDGKALSTALSAISLVGVALIFTGFIRFTAGMIYPGWAGLYPVLGTVLIISAGPRSWFNRVVLSNRVLVWVGLISFPLYLWHWPLLSFARILESDTPSSEIRAAAVFLSFVLAWATYRIVEKPVRFGKHREIKAASLVGLACVVGALGYSTYKWADNQYRMEATNTLKGEIGDQDFHQYLARHYLPCTPMSLYLEAKQDPELRNFNIRCHQSMDQEAKSVAIIGDSHSEHLFPGIAKSLPGVNVVNYMKAGSPLIDNDKFKNVFFYILTDENIETVILAWRWPRYGTLNIYNYKSSIEKTVDALSDANKKVYIIADNPDFPFDPQQCKYSHRLFSAKSRHCGIASKDYKSTYGITFSLLESIQYTRQHLNLVKVYEYFCDDSLCSMRNDDTLLFRDRDHLNVDGSIYLTKRIAESFSSSESELWGSVP
jgi:hypothetical protein